MPRGVPAVPARIFVGPTCYQHHATGKKDLYSPDFFFPQPPKDHTWRYGVSAEHGGTVFFNNEGTRQSVWVLPVVDAKTGQTRPLGEEEMMRAEGEVRSAKDAHEGQPRPSSNKDTPSTRHGAGGAVAGDDNKAGVVVVSSSTARTSPVSDTRSTSPLSATAVPRPRRPDRGPTDAAAATNSEPQQRATRQEIDQAVTRAVAAKTAEPQRPQSGVADAAPRGSVQERLAAYRARKNQHATGAVAHHDSSGGAPAHVNTGPSATDAHGAAAATGGAAAPARGGSVGARSQPDRAPSHDGAVDTSMVGDFVAALYEQRSREEVLVEEALQRERLATLEEERLAYERRRRQVAEAAAEEAERLRMARARKAAEEHRLALVSAYPTRGQERDDPSRQAPADAQGGWVGGAAVDAANAFFSRQAEVVSQAEETTAKAVDLERAIVDALSAAAPSTPEKLQPKPALGVLEPAVGRVRGQIEGRPGGGKSDHRGTAVAAVDGAARRRERGSVKYSSAFKYVGDITTFDDRAPAQTRQLLRDMTNTTTDPQGGLHTLLATTPGATPLPVREGEGTLHRMNKEEGDGGSTIIVSQASNQQRQRQPRGVDGGGSAATGDFFRGTWRDDKRSGRGLLSLSNTALEGEWQDDRLVPSSRPLLQTRRMKGVFTAAEGSQAAPRVGREEEPRRVRFAGPAMMELADGSHVAGHVDTARGGGRGVLGPAVLQLRTGERIEWLPEDAKGRRRGPAHDGDFHHSAEGGGGSTTESAQGRGTGRCRVQFQRGDEYVGSIAAWQLHGYGSYRFGATANTYTGFFYRGRMQGEGTYRFANGDVYVGEFFHDAFHGIGCYVHKDAYIYEGEWRDGHMEGKGVVTFSNGDQWRGVFARDAMKEGGYAQFQL